MTGAGRAPCVVPSTRRASQLRPAPTAWFNYIAAVSVVQRPQQAFNCSRQHGRINSVAPPAAAGKSGAGAADTSPSATPASPATGSRTSLGLYELLGVDQASSSRDIKAAYRCLARVYHPDVNSSPSCQRRFQAISKAYEVLCDSELRKQYDTYGFRALRDRAYDDLLKFCGHGRQEDADLSSTYSSYNGQAPEKGEDVFTVMGMPLDEAVTGANRVVTVHLRRACSSCSGSGLAQGVQAVVCPVCRGRRKLLRTLRRPDNPVPVPTLGDCPACGGSGHRSAVPCSSCSGEGRGVAGPLGVQVSVPAGANDGNVLRLRGLGHVGKYGGQAGDLYIKLNVHPCINLERQGQDLYSQLEIHLYDALLGGRISVHTPRGERMLTVPEGTQTGDKLKLEGGGVAAASKGTIAWGHHFFDVRVVVPDGGKMAEEERKVLESLGRLDTGRLQAWW